MPVNADWTTLGLQLGGAIVVCGMFLAFLIKKAKADDEARKEFLDHLSEKDDRSEAAADRHVQYLKERDAQSKDIAMSGHEVARDLVAEMQRLRETLIEQRRV